MVCAGLRWRPLVGVLVVVLTLTGCSSGPSASDWATAVCNALGPWRSTIADLNRQAASQMASATTGDQTKANLITLVSGARAASERARAAVAAAGTPDVDGGAGVAGQFEASLADTRDAYAKAEADLAALATEDESAFYDGVVAILSRLQSEYQAGGVDLTSLDSPELTKAFDGIAECR